jgi:hypothetical protein
MRQWQGLQREFIVFNSGVDVTGEIAYLIHQIIPMYILLEQTMHSDALPPAIVWFVCIVRYFFTVAAHHCQTRKKFLIAEIESPTLEVDT